VRPQTIDDLYIAAKKYMKKKYPGAQHFNDLKQIKYYSKKPSVNELLSKKLDDQTLAGQYLPTKYRGSSKEMQDIFKNDIIYNPGDSPVVFLHELGHLIRQRKKSPITRFTRSIRSIDESLTDREARKLIKKLGRNLPSSEKEFLLNILTR